MFRKFYLDFYQAFNYFNQTSKTFLTHVSSMAENPYCIYAQLYSNKAADYLPYVSFFTYLFRCDLSHQFCEFQYFLGNFSVKVIFFTLSYSNTPVQKNLTECKFMLFLIWTISSVCSDNTKSRWALKKLLYM